MTVRHYRFIAGNAWGKPRGMEGPEHYWLYLTDQDRGKWKSACDEHTIESDDNFAGVPFISLAYEHNPLHWSRCEACAAIYTETDYGKRFGIHPPNRESVVLD